MPRIIIDGQPVDVPSGTSILEAAWKLGIDIPNLCYLPPYRPQTSCLVCLVKLADRGQFVPACGTLVQEGMLIDSETLEVRTMRRTSLELLLGDHAGDCLAPCQFACPAHMDIPLMLRQITQRDFSHAIVTIKHDIALPAVLGRLCSRPCEKGCRRNPADGPVAVCQLKRFVADWDLGQANPYLPPVAPPTGKRVIIVGAGPTGLAAAWHLRQFGHEVLVFEAAPEAGGRIRKQSGAELGRDLQEDERADVLSALAGETRLIEALGVEFRFGVELGRTVHLNDLAAQADAILLAWGSAARPLAERYGLETTTRGIAVDRTNFQTNQPGIFAAGTAVRGKNLLVRSVADGKEAAWAIHQFLQGELPSEAAERFSVRLGRVDEDELKILVARASSSPRWNGEDLITPLSEPVAVEQASRCLHCNCRGLSRCKLRRYAALYGADPNRFRGSRPKLRLVGAAGDVIYEPGKCIDCGLCVEITSQSAEVLGLTFVGRGFEMRVGVPFGRAVAEALGALAAKCVAACPTGALSFKESTCQKALSASTTLPILRAH